MAAVEAPAEQERPTRSEVAEYVHDMAGQLSELAERAGLGAAAEALKSAQRAIEGDF